MAAQITLQNVAVGISEILIRNVTFSLGEGDRLGVVGNNGAGKTTLLRCIAGLVDPWEGSIARPKGKRLVFVEQTTPPHLLALTLREAVLDAIGEDDRDSLGWKVDVVLDQFGTPEDTIDRPLSKLSGGWQRLALIARAWASDPDILIIDEPTNHLDLTKIIMLENWLQREMSTTPLLIVSHDRRFLETCTNRTLFVRPGESRMYAYSFSRARQLLDDDDRALENKKERELMELQRLRKSAHNLRQIGVDNYSAAALRKSIQIGKRADAIQESLPVTHVEQKRDIRLASQATHAKRLVGIKDLTISRPDGVPLFRIGKLDIGPAERVAVLGRNGSGKTQLVRKLRAGFGQPDDAREQGLVIAPSLIMGYLDQNMSQLPDNENLRDYLNGTYGTGLQRTIALLASAGFPLAQHTTIISQLSPGERARLALLALRLRAPNFYLMDEPTNHLDISGQEQLETEILAHEAAAVLVSHDRAFVEHVGTRFLVVENTQILEIEEPDLFYKSLIDNVALLTLSSRAKIL